MPTGDVSACQEEGFRLISEALGLDERETTVADKAPAILLYERGIAELEKGVALFIPVPLPLFSLTLWNNEN